jgi:hypothetical protein
LNSILDSLWHEMRGAFERLPVWLPNTSMALGDVGTFGDGGWVRHTTLHALGVAFRTEQSPDATDYEYASSDGATVTGSLSGAGPAGAGGSGAMSIEFSRAGAVALHAYDVRVRSIADLADVEARILDLHPARRWRRDWIFVHEVAEGGPVAVMVAGSTEAAARIELGVQALPHAPGAGNARGGFRITHGRNLAASFTAAGPAPILWRGRYVQGSWFRGDSIIERGRQTPVTPDEDVPVEVHELEFPDDVATADDQD